MCPSLDPSEKSSPEEWPPLQPGDSPKLFPELDQPRNSYLPVSLSRSSRKGSYRLAKLPSFPSQFNSDPALFKAGDNLKQCQEHFPFQGRLVKGLIFTGDQEHFQILTQ